MAAAWWRIAQAGAHRKMSIYEEKCRATRFVAAISCDESRCRHFKRRDLSPLFRVTRFVVAISCDEVRRRYFARRGSSLLLLGDDTIIVSRYIF